MGKIIPGVLDQVQQAIQVGVGWLEEREQINKILAGVPRFVALEDQILDVVGRRFTARFIEQAGYVSGKDSSIFADLVSFD